MKVLFCSIAFPPKRDPECLQAMKYFKYLSGDKDLSIDVLTSSIPTLFMDFDDTLRKHDTGWDEKHEIRIPENKYLNYLLRVILPNGLEFPDSKFLFHWQWKKAVKRIRRPDLIYSRSNPLSSTIMAYHLKAHYNVPWVMHLSDPWLYSPIHQYNSKQRKWHSKWERKCLELADRICLTSMSTIELYKGEYPELKNKFEFFPNVFDVSQIQERSIDFSQKLRFVYTGGLINDRSVEWFLSVFQDLNDKYPGIEEIIEIIFAGEMDRPNRAIFANLSFQFVRHVGSLTYNEAIDLQSSAHVLINIDNPIKDSMKAVFFPSKILDYFLAKRRILCLTTVDSASFKILEDYNSDVCENHNSEMLLKFFESAIAEWKNRNIDYFAVKNLPVLYNADRNAARLSKLFQELCGKEPLE